MEPIPLSDQDVAILELEGPTVAGHTCKVIRLGAESSLDQLRARVAARLDSAPILRTRLGGPEGRPAWVADPDFDLDRHLVPWAADPITAERLPRVVASLFEQRLERDRPLWRIDLVRIQGGATALVWRLHHALADGTTAMRFARALLWDEPVGGRAAADAPTTPGKGGSAGDRPTGDDRSDHRRRRGHLASFLEREFAESIRPSPFDGEIGARRQIAFASVGFDALHAAAKEICGATVNDAVLCITAGGVRRWIEEHHGSLGALRFRVPVSLHQEGDQASNRDSFFTLPVHLEEADPAIRLRAIHAAANERKADRDAERLERLLSELRAQAPPLASLAERLEAAPRSFALCVSNVPGPSRPVAVLGAPVNSLHSVAEIGRRHGLRVTVVSLAGRLHFGLCADPAIADDLAEMAAGIEAEAEQLAALI